MIVHTLPYIIFRSYSNFGYLTDNRNYGYDTASRSCEKVGDLLLSEAASIFYSVLSSTAQNIDSIVTTLCQLFPGALPSIIRNDAIEFYTDLHTKGFIFAGNEDIDRKKSYFSYDNWEPCYLNLAQVQTNDFTYEETFGRNSQLARVHIDVSGRCNENCIHCYIPNKCKCGLMTKELFENILFQCKEMNVINLTISGGEPMLNPHLKYFLELCRKYNFSVNILSNLTLLSDEILDVLEDNPLFSIQTSLYAMVEDIHDSITRCSGSYQKTLDSILRLHERNIPMQINCPIMKQNMSYYKDVLSFAQSKNIEADADYSLFGSYDCSRSNLVCRLSIEEVEKVIMDAHRDIMTQKEVSENKKKDLSTPICPVCKSSLCISNSGDIYPCEGWQSLKFGNLSNLSLRDVWESSPQVKELRELSYGHFPKCASCLHKSFCSPCLIMNANEDPDGNYSIVNKYTCEITRIKAKLTSKYSNPSVS